MKKLIRVILLIFFSQTVYSQVYFPMPVDSAVWRYRLYDADYVIQLTDCILYVNGTDTEANGNTYHKIFSRVHQSFVSIDSALPPVTDVYASYPDTYFGAIREAGRQIFQLNLSGEQLLFNFNAVIGDSIPTTSGNVKVIDIDSVLLGGSYHRRFLTTDPTYYAIEGVGSSRGLIPPFIDGSPNQQFLCFTNAPVLFSPDSSIPCTYVYPLGYDLEAAKVTDNTTDPQLYPLPVSDVLHVVTDGFDSLQVSIFNGIGQRVWFGRITGEADISVVNWPKGLYYAEFIGSGKDAVTKKIIVN